MLILSRKAQQAIQMVVKVEGQQPIVIDVLVLATGTTIKLGIEADPEKVEIIRKELLERE